MEAVGTTEENKMGTKPVWSLLMTMAAITFANPLVTILIAVGSGIAVGMNTMLSHGLGEKDQRG